MDNIEKIFEKIKNYRVLTEYDSNVLLDHYRKVTDDVLELFTNEEIRDGLNFIGELYSLRHAYAEAFSWHLMTWKQIEQLTNFIIDGKTIEVFSGNGFLTGSLNQTLEKRGTQRRVEGYDIYITPTRTALGITKKDVMGLSLENVDNVIMAWPALNENVALQVLKNMSDDSTLFYQGEGIGGCCANDEFFEYLDEHFTLDESKTQMLNISQYQWSGIRDNWYVYSKTVE